MIGTLSQGVSASSAGGAGCRSFAIGECSDSVTKEIGMPCFDPSMSVRCRALRLASRQPLSALQLALESSVARYMAPAEVLP